VRLFKTEAQIGLKLMQNLSPELQEKARIFKRMHDTNMENDRWHPADEVHNFNSINSDDNSDI
jgi:hypothetical protein